MFLKRLTLAAAALLAMTGSAVSEPYVMDKSHAQITFSVDHLGFSTVHGQFRDFDAQIDFEPEAVETSRVRFVIQASSVDTFWQRRDDHLRSPDFFDVEKHPEIIFESTSIKPTGSDTAAVTGDLTIKGVTRETTFDTKLNKLGPSPFDPARQIAGFTATAEIDRTQFGVSFATPAVSAIVPIRIDLEMSPAN